jgi:hypothetical protein
MSLSDQSVKLYFLGLPFYLEENPYDSYKTGEFLSFPPRPPPPAMAAKETLSSRYF